jgi:glycosyltransferase involved in cell wall biosynthesis
VSISGATRNRPNSAKALDSALTSILRIVIFNWRDTAHPRAGGAEVYTDVIARGLAARGHDVVLRTASFPGAAECEVVGGYRVVRAGNAVTCRFAHAAWLARHRAEVDVVVDEVNTLPFLSPLIAPAKVVLLMHQIAREVWNYEAPPVIGWMGRLAEPFLLSVYRSTPSVTVSHSTSRSLRELGLRGPNDVVHNALQPAVEPYVTRAEVGMMLYVGRVTPSKRIDHIVRAVAHVRDQLPVRLVVIGGGLDREFRRLRALATQLGVADAVEFRGRVSEAERDDFLSRADLLLLSSVREGWGLVVSEAARWRVPTVAYDVPGLRDSIIDDVTGILVPDGDHRAFSAALADLVKDRLRRDEMGRAAADYLSQFGEVAAVERFEANLLEAIKAPCGS